MVSVMKAVSLLTSSMVQVYSPACDVTTGENSMISIVITSSVIGAYVSMRDEFVISSPSGPSQAIISGGDRLRLVTVTKQVSVNGEPATLTASLITSMVKAAARTNDC